MSWQRRLGGPIWLGHHPPRSGVPSGSTRQYHRSSLTHPPTIRTPTSPPQPPSWWRRLLRLRVTQRFAPQCRPCSQRQASAVREGKRVLIYHHWGLGSLRRYHATGGAAEALRVFVGDQVRGAGEVRSGWLVDGFVGPRFFLLLFCGMSPITRRALHFNFFSPSQHVRYGHYSIGASSSTPTSKRRSPGPAASSPPGCRAVAWSGGANDDDEWVAFTVIGVEGVGVQIPPEGGGRGRAS